MRTVQKVIIFENGNVAVLDEAGAQMTEHQCPLALGRVIDMMQAGVIVDDTIIETRIDIFGKSRLTGQEIRLWLEAHMLPDNEDNTNENTP